MKNVLAYFGGVFLTMLFLGLVTIGGLVVALRGGVSEEDLASLRVKSDHGVGVVELTGEITTSAKFAKGLKGMLENKKIKAVVVRIDSPGGAVGASEEIYRLIEEGNKKKPVVCSLGSIAASGGLFAAVGCKKIISNESTMTGSIGVIVMMPNVAGLLDRFGVHMNVVRSGKLKDAGTPFREMLPEERDYLQGLIDISYAQFVRTIAQSRNIPEEKVRAVADGRILLGGQAKEIGIVDEFGGLERAAKVGLELAGDKDGEPELVRVSEATGLMAYLKEASDLPLLKLGSSMQGVRLMYLSDLGL